MFYQPIILKLIFVFSCMIKTNTSYLLFFSTFSINYILLFTIDGKQLDSIWLETHNKSRSFISMLSKLSVFFFYSVVFSPTYFTNEITCILLLCSTSDVAWSYKLLYLFFQYIGTVSDVYRDFDSGNRAMILSLLDEKKVRSVELFILFAPIK